MPSIHRLPLLLALIAALVAASTTHAASSADSANFTIDLRHAAGLELSAVGSPQTVGAPFALTLTAKDGGGNVVPYEGVVNLDAGFSGVTPARVWLSGGTVTIPVSLDTPGTGVVLSASGGGLMGQSNAFDLTGGSCLASLEVRVSERTGAPFGGATVHLSNGSTCVADETYGRCSFLGLAPGRYSAYAELPVGSTDPVSFNMTCNPRSLRLAPNGSACNPTGLTPILLVPGIMGSTTSSWSIYPKLPRNPPTASDWPSWNFKDEGGLLDPTIIPSLGGVAGWRRLVDVLEQDSDTDYEYGCTIFAVPYDWRMEAGEAAETYLKPAITRAKLAAGTDRVHIVAHSMGGIVARSYIQGGSYPQPGDIDKLAMVGTPNHGAAVAYFLWEGADPVVADRVATSIAGSFFGRLLDFYTVSAQFLYREQYGENLTEADYITDRPRYRAGMLKLIRGIGDDGTPHVPSIRQLLPSDEDSFLLDGSSSRGLECSDHQNHVLNDLNSDPSLSRLGSSSDPDPDHVRTQIFASSDTATLNQILVSDSAPSCRGESAYYEDGQPRVEYQVQSGLWTTAVGDGTVKTTSASVPGPTFLSWPAGEHAKLVSALRCKIAGFLLGSQPSSCSSRDSRGIPPIALLTLATEGRPQPLLSDPTAAASGIDPGTAELRTEILGSVVDADDQSVGVEVEEPVSGLYTVELGGSYAEEVDLVLNYLAEETTFHASYSAFYDGTPRTFSFQLNPASVDPITVALDPPPPTNLRADYSGANTDLVWDPSSDGGVSSYRVYGRTEGEAHFVLLGNPTGPSFATGQPWAADQATPTRLYYVAAVYGDGTESFFSNLARNDDRDHDGITDWREIQRGTEVDNPDSDGDGLSDGEEEFYGTSPLDADSDGDGWNDGTEVREGSDPRDPETTPDFLFVDGFETGDLSAWSS